jgi:protoporphyrinogen/coproporphyrinogen III oxidase
MRHVVIIGAGISGLAAAHALREVDVRITVVEGAGRIGGKLRTSSVGDVDVDEGAESFLVRRPEARDLAVAVGLADDVVHPATTRASVWSRGRLRPLPARTLFGVPSSVPSLRGVLTAAEVARAGADLVLPPGAAIDDVSVGSLVRHRLGDAVAERLVDPLLGGVYAGRADELSVRATAPSLATNGSLVRAAATAVGSGMDGPVFGTVRGGLGRLVSAVAQGSGAEIVLGRTVRRLERTAAGFRVVHGPTIDELAIDADAVVVAVPAAAAARLLRDVAPSAAADLSAIDYASVALVTTVWGREQIQTPGGSGYLVPAVERRSVKAVTFASSKWAHLDGDLVVVRCSFGRHGDTAELQRDDDDLVALAVAELRLTAGASGSPVASRVSRWGGGLPQYAVGHVDRVRRIRAAVAAVPGLAVCGAAYDGVGIPACIASGVRAAGDVVTDAR